MYHAATWRCRGRGHEAHSSLTPRGVNAVQIACEIHGIAQGTNQAIQLRGLEDAAQRGGRAMRRVVGLG